ncbi:hypothetical protein [Dactylosporangium sp. CA-139066]|uniref:hypothetical protein n=1 Tax=Dactylosporangium sp. CA-139066 TaxID=3239930 RepID=UPI003D8D3AF5
MTQTSTAAPIATIPAAGLVQVAGDVEIRAFYVNGAGYKVQARRNGQLIASQLHTFETHAIAAIEALIAEHTAPEPTPAAPAIPTQRLAPAAKGTQTFMSPAEVIVIGEALETTGHIRRGRGHAAADLRSLQAMARRGFVTLTGHPFRPDGAEVNDWGRRAYKEAVAAQQEQHDRAERLAAIVAITAA